MISTLISDLGFEIQGGSANSRECSLGSIMQTHKDKLSICGFAWPWRMYLCQSTVRQTELERAASGSTGRLIVILCHGIWLEFHCNEYFVVCLAPKEEREAQKSHNPRQDAMGRMCGAQFCWAMHVVYLCLCATWAYQCLASFFENIYFYLTYEIVLFTQISVHPNMQCQ